MSSTMSMPPMENGPMQNGAPFNDTGMHSQPQMMNPSMKQGAPVPIFVAALEGGCTIPEGESVHLETMLEPRDDNSMVIDWFKDGQPLRIGSRFNTVYDRGYAVLDILYTFPEDSGHYICQASNKFGYVQSNDVMVTVIPEASVETETVDEEAIMKMVQMENFTEPPDRYDRNLPQSAPTFVSQPVPQVELMQGNPLHLNVQVAESQDPTLQLEWFKNGAPLTAGSRFGMVYTRGYASLDIAYCFPEDSGTYFCLARNGLGETQSSPSQIVCYPDEAIVTKSNLSESSIQHLKYLDEPGADYNPYSQQEQLPVPPNFISQLEPNSLELQEGTFGRYDVRIDAGSGQNISVEWFKDGQLVNTGSRINCSFELGIASLIFRNVHSEDSGSYQCVVRTEFGEAQSSAASLQCAPDNFVVNTSQLTGNRGERGLMALQELEEEINRPLKVNLDMAEPDRPPEFVKGIDLLPPMDEGDPVMFDVKVEPLDDNSLVIEWYKNGEELHYGSRFHVEFERGIGILRINYTIPEDNGEYWCVAKSKKGQSESNHVQLQCTPSQGVITTSNLSEGSAGLRWITEMDQEYTSQDYSIARYSDQQEAESAPLFDVKPISLVAGEGQPVKFLVRVSGNPLPEVIWFIEEQPLKQLDSNIHVYNDGPISCLEFHRCTDVGEIAVKAVATNSLGNAVEHATLTVVPKGDFRPEMKHIKPENQYLKLMRLKKVECTAELSEALKKKTPADVIRNIDRGWEMKARSYKCPDVQQAEQMYDQIAANLKTQGNLSATPTIQAPLVQGQQYEAVTNGE